MSLDHGILNTPQPAPIISDTDIATAERLAHSMEIEFDAEMDRLAGAGNWIEQLTPRLSALMFAASDLRGWAFAAQSGSVRRSLRDAITRTYTTQKARFGVSLTEAV